MKNSSDIIDIENLTGLRNSDIFLIKEKCLTVPAVKSVILFGSRAKGNWKHGSDIDLCITGECLSSDNLTLISRELNEETNLPYSFDIIDWNKIQNQEISLHIERCGIIL